ncbi:MAG: hypothetical protein LC112_07635 [Flavobacteriales bacterium]|nr:hypothetical protein [Flavobacteriales bacterium]
MNKELLMKVLQLDSIIEKLTWQERMMIHFFLQGKSEITTRTIDVLYAWVKSLNWEPPLMKIGQDRLKYCYDPNLELWFPVEEYRDITPDIIDSIKKLEQW